MRGLLAHLPLFQGVGRGELERIARGTTRRVLRRAEVLFRRGERPTGFYLVVVGRIALKASAARGRERVTDIIGPGRSFGEAIMFLDKPCIVTAASMGDAVVLHVAKDTVFGELERNPAFARRIIAALSAKLEASVRELDSYALGSGGARFAGWLSSLLPEDAAGAVSITLPAAKKTVASTLNLSAEHLSRVLRQLAAEGLIETHGRTMRVPDAARLRDWSRTRGRFS